MSTPECLHISAWCNINKHVFCASLSYIKTYRLNIDNAVIVVHGIDIVYCCEAKRRQRV